MRTWLSLIISAASLLNISAASSLNISAALLLNICDALAKFWCLCEKRNCYASHMRIIMPCAGKRVDCRKMARLNSTLPPFFWLLTFFLAQLFHPRFVYRTTEHLRNRKRTADCVIDNGYEERERKRERERRRKREIDEGAMMQIRMHLDTLNRSCPVDFSLTILFCKDVRVVPK